LAVQNLRVQKSTLSYGQLGETEAELSISRLYLAGTKPKESADACSQCRQSLARKSFHCCNNSGMRTQRVTWTSSCEMLLEMPYGKERKWTVPQTTGTDDHCI